MRFALYCFAQLTFDWRLPYLFTSPFAEELKVGFHKRRSCGGLFHKNFNLFFAAGIDLKQTLKFIL